jgi:hypothetical protein
MAQDEERNSGICDKICNIPISKGGTSATCKAITTSSDSIVEMGTYYYGFCIQVTKKQK